MEPIKNGDVCIIINGVTGKNSPNIGKIITVGKTVGEHSIHGRIVEVFGKNISTTKTIDGDAAMSPVKWLKKLPPEDIPPSTLTVDKTEKI